jgi:hypothetical protein
LYIICKQGFGIELVNVLLYLQARDKKST